MAKKQGLKSTLSPGSINGYMAKLRALMTFAVNEGWIDRNPATGRGRELARRYHKRRPNRHPSSPDAVLVGGRDGEGSVGEEEGVLPLTNLHQLEAAKVDWSSLAGREVVIFPDADESGRKSATMWPSTSEKTRPKLAKHSVSLALGVEMDMETAKFVVDVRRDYGEQRFNALGLIGDRVYAITFATCPPAVRIISPKGEQQGTETLHRIRAA